jgi:hypothetical protein
MRSPAASPAFSRLILPVPRFRSPIPGRSRSEPARRSNAAGVRSHPGAFQGLLSPQSHNQASDRTQ